MKIIIKIAAPKLNRHRVSFYTNNDDILSKLGELAMTREELDIFCFALRDGVMNYQDGEVTLEIEEQESTPAFLRGVSGNGEESRT